MNNYIYKPSMAVPLYIHIYVGVFHMQDKSIYGDFFWGMGGFGCGRFAIFGVALVLVE